MDPTSKAFVAEAFPKSESVFFTKEMEVHWPRIFQVFSSINSLSSISDIEARALYQMAFEGNTPYLEIGTKLGRTTTLLALVAELKGTYVVTIDPYLEIAFEKSQEYFEKKGVRHLVKPVIAFSQAEEAFLQAQEILGGEHLSLLWIDGAHSYPATRDDILHYWPLLKVGGKIALHDMFRRRWFVGVDDLVIRVLLCSGLNGFARHGAILTATKVAVDLNWPFHLDSDELMNSGPAASPERAKV